jgi:hypothetical protein
MIFSSWFSKVTIECIPNRTAAEGGDAEASRGGWRWRRAGNIPAEQRVHGGIEIPA